MLRRGQLRHLLNIQVKDPTGGQNSVGEESIVWIDDTEVWGAIYPLRGMEYHFSREQTAVITHKVKTMFFKLSDGSRPQPGTFRIRYYDHKLNQNRYFDPQGGPIVEDERQWYQEIFCVESV